MTINKIKASLLLGTTALSLAAGVASADEKPETYTVKSGDTLSTISEKFFQTSDYVDEIAKVNNIQNINLIHVGQELKLKGVEEVLTNSEGQVSQETVQAQQAPVENYSAPVQSYQASPTSQAGGSVILSNGNTAGATGASAAAGMAARTGVPASTWEAIIARESNGQVNAYNPSGASGLFQTMPGWGSTATVADQINAATRAYQAQGLSAWGF